MNSNDQSDDVDVVRCPTNYTFDLVLLFADRFIDISSEEESMTLSAVL